MLVVKCDRCGEIFERTKDTPIAVKTKNGVIKTNTIRLCLFDANEEISEILMMDLCPKCLQDLSDYINKFAEKKEKKDETL